MTVEIAPTISPLMTRRTALFAAAACMLAPSAYALVPLPSDPGFRAWTRPSGAGGLPLQEAVETDIGSRPLIEWIGRRPAVIALWASWCGPCLIEKPHQAALARRLAAAGAATRIFALQAFDGDIALGDARWMLDRIGAQALPLARASQAAEIALQHVLSANPHDRTRMTLPIVLLVGGDGLELGRAIGPMHGADGRSDYWQDEATFNFLRRLV